ncbi:MAG: DUF362 domain-containing protein [Candidatus Aminicenantes bacterium]
MKKAAVSLVKLHDYDINRIRQALQKSLDLLGGLENIIKPHSRVFVKINHLSPPSPPEKAIVTHPALTKEFLQLLKEHHVKITVGDDIQSREKDGFSVSGYRQICDELGVPLVNLKEIGFKELSCKGQVLKKVYISPPLLESDFIINLPKLKTHSFTIYTGAVKNMFGIIPSGLRLKYHRQYSNNEVFSQMLVDIFSCVPPHLNLMDAVVAMEGEGPSAGNPRNLGIILASRDAVALDAVASKIAGFNPMDIFTTQNAHQRGLGEGSMDEIAVLGEKIEDVEVRDFKHSAVAIGFLRRKIPTFLYAFIQGQLTLIPEVMEKKCTLCGECLSICPKGAMRSNQNSAWIDKNLCIHCMCCHEVCRFHSIKLKQKTWGRIIRSVRSLHHKLKYLFS